MYVSRLHNDWSSESSGFPLLGVQDLFVLLGLFVVDEEEAQQDHTSTYPVDEASVLRIKQDLTDQ